MTTQPTTTQIQMDRPRTLTLTRGVQITTRDVRGLAMQVQLVHNRRGGPVRVLASDGWALTERHVAPTVHAALTWAAENLR